MVSQLFIVKRQVQNEIKSSQTFIMYMYMYICKHFCLYRWVAEQKQHKKNRLFKIQFKLCKVNMYEQYRYYRHFIEFEIELLQ